MIEARILGKPGGDNALLVDIDSGQEQASLLVDTGEVSLSRLGKAKIQSLSHLCLSHGHMDHICGFDSLFRTLYSRPEPFQIFGPRQTREIIQHRLQGYLWNLVRNKPGEMQVFDILEKKIKGSKYFCREKFKKQHPFPDQPRQGSCVFSNHFYSIHASILDHNTASVSYNVRENTRHNINLAKIKALGFTPGKWCKDLKDFSQNDATEILIKDHTYTLGNLRKEMLETKEGMRVGYVTDIVFSQENLKRLKALHFKSDLFFIESNYKDSEAELAAKNFHLTLSQALTIANTCEVKKLIIFHISDRYSRKDRQEMLAFAKDHHPDVSLPDHWDSKIITSQPT